MIHLEESKVIKSIQIVLQVYSGAECTWHRDRVFPFAFWARTQTWSKLFSAMIMMILPDVLSGKGQGGSHPDSRSDTVPFFLSLGKLSSDSVCVFSVRVALFPSCCTIFQPDWLNYRKVKWLTCRVSHESVAQLALNQILSCLPVQPPDSTQLLSFIGGL